ncbi:hypothetical protein V0288_24220 [Pannus brasiliensis CCIBt3594]|uniref:Uncharacterized protein n=1 Tax=Pannus brasiliensis CCIBt3594 TaxID=1427578 RepID=A0AAW9QTK6_9CHRO
MKITLAFFVAVSLLLGSIPHAMARTLNGERFDSTPLSSILQNRECKGDKDDDCQ